MSSGMDRDWNRTELELKYDRMELNWNGTESNGIE